jgi:TRAP-type C4-dicarboxylate transport system substrate-binding protein
MRMQSLFVRSAVLGIGAVCGALLAALPATAQVTLKLTTLDREQEVTSQPLIWWMKTIEEKTSGRVKFQPFWSQSLVPAPRTMSAVKSGIADVGYLVSALLTAEEKDFGPLDIDGALPTDERYVQAWEAIKGPITRILDRHGIEMMWPRRSPKVVISCKNKFLTQASDYVGTKIRVAGRWESMVISRWGASVFSIPPSDTYTALQTGTVDCTYHVYPVVWALKFYEVAPYVTQLDDSSAFTFIGANKAKWNQISEADRNVIRGISNEAMHREIDVLGKREAGIVEDMKKAGARFHQPSAAERKRLVEAIKPVWAEIRKAVGPNGVELTDILERMQPK